MSNKDEFIKTHTEKQFDNYRVVATPDLFWPKTHEKKYRCCKNIAASIKRHVDDIDEAEPDFDCTDICKFCSLEMEWFNEESDTDTIPACCDDAQAAWTEWKQNAETTEATKTL